MAQTCGNLIAALRQKTDKINGIALYTHPNSPRFVNSRTSVYLRIGQQDRKIVIFATVQYVASNWLFVQRVTAYHDGQSQPLELGQFERDNKSQIWEWVDIPADPVLLLQLEDLATAKDAVLRFHGHQYTKDNTLSEADKNAIREMLEAYNILKERR